MFDYTGCYAHALHTWKVLGNRRFLAYRQCLIIDKIHAIFQSILNINDENEGQATLCPFIQFEFHPMGLHPMGRECQERFPRHSG